MAIKRGELYYADLSPAMGAEEGGTRPVLIISNDLSNRYSPMVIVAAVTSRSCADMPTHVALPSQKLAIIEGSTVLLEQVRAIDKRRLKERIGRVDDEVMQAVDAAIRASLSLD